MRKGKVWICLCLAFLFVLPLGIAYAQEKPIKSAFKLLLPGNGLTREKWLKTRSRLPFR